MSWQVAPLALQHSVPFDSTVLSLALGIAAAREQRVRAFPAELPPASCFLCWGRMSMLLHPTAGLHFRPSADHFSKKEGKPQVLFSQNQLDMSVLPYSPKQCNLFCDVA